MQKKEEAGDLRVRRSRILLQKACVELTIEKGFANLTVQDITERAMVNRSTFYRHYLDKYALLDHFMEEVFELTDLGETEEAWLGSKILDEKTSQVPIGLVRMLKQVQSHASFYRAMLGKNGDPTFAKRISQYIEKRFRQLLPDAIRQTNQARPPLELGLSYVAYAGIGALVWWLENDLPCSPEELGLWISQFSQADMRLILGDYSVASDASSCG